jgi:hypothetical protein
LPYPDEEMENEAASPGPPVRAGFARTGVGSPACAASCLQREQK